MIVEEGRGIRGGRDRERGRRRRETQKNRRRNKKEQTQLMEMMGAPKNK